MKKVSETDELHQAKECGQGKQNVSQDWSERRLINFVRMGPFL